MPCLKMTTFATRFIRRFPHQQVKQHCRAHSWTSSEIRSSFYEYFKGQDHQYVHSSSVIPPKQGGTYFVNAGMNQFKPIFLGTFDSTSALASYKRVFNSQKCIRVGGKHNDLADVGRDTYHHTFFEMLGSWSFGDYFKREACQMAWALLTEVYQLPKNRLFVTYFGGNTELDLQPDLECRDIWLSLGVAADHILPCGSADNFWDMGETGPCGPCTEIHYDRTLSNNGRELVNTGSADVLELWNLVFMQYDRQGDGSLILLPAHHVDTGMGLERLTAVLQGKLSNYDTDLFTPLFNMIHQSCRNAPYRGRTGVQDVDGTDTAYRVVADHARMLTVAIADGLRPGSHNLDSKLRQILDQCLNQAILTLHAPPGALVRLVPVVVDILGDAFPELNQNVQTVIDIVNSAEDRYRFLLQKGEEILRKVCPSGTQTLSGRMLVNLQDGVWQDVSIPVDIAVSIATKMNIPLIDVQGYNAIMAQQKEKQMESMLVSGVIVSKLTGKDLKYLRDRNIGETDSHYKYNQKWDATGQLSLGDVESSLVLAVKSGSEFVDSLSESDRCSIILDKTPFYAEGGGQISDIGTLSNKDCVICIEDVQDTGGYVSHTGYVQSGNLHTGNLLQPSVDMARRQQCAVNHSASHLLNHALRRLVDGVTQHGSRVTDQKLAFDFICATPRLPDNFLEDLTVIVNEMIERKMDVDWEEIPLDTARSLPEVVLLKDEVYPSRPRVVTMGTSVDELVSDSPPKQSYSAELCGGCHVDNTGRIKQFVITQAQGIKHAGTKRVVAVTGSDAVQITENSKNLEDIINQLEQDIQSKIDPDSWHGRRDRLDRLLFNEGYTLPKVDRDNFISRIAKNTSGAVNYMKNKTQKDDLGKEIEALLEGTDGEFVVCQFSGVKPMKKLASAVSMCSPNRPVLLFSAAITPKGKKTAKSKPQHLGASTKRKIAVAYVPKMKFNQERVGAASVSAKDWITYLASLCQKGQRLGPVDVKSDDGELHFMTFLVDDVHDLCYFMEHARNYMENTLDGHRCDKHVSS